MTLIANRTIFANGNILINHITTLGDNGELMSAQPFDHELPNTRYCSGTIAILPKRHAETARKLMGITRSPAEFAKKLKQAIATEKSLPAEPHIALQLNFSSHSATEIL